MGKPKFYQTLRIVERQGMRYRHDRDSIWMRFDVELGQYFSHIRYGIQQEAEKMRRWIDGGSMTQFRVTLIAAYLRRLESRAERAEAEVARLRWALQSIADGGFPATIIARRALSPDEGTEG